MVTPGPLQAVLGQLLTYFHGLTTRQVLATSADILIVYYLIYRVLRLLRGTRAMQMLVGMSLVALCFSLAKRLELTTVSWLFENLIQYFIIFLIVIFQHDIRRGLTQVGQNLFRGQRYEETYVIEEVVQAADTLARHKIGALIVLERAADLGDHLGEVGVVLDAKVTKELLVTLFIPDAENHMHDGAVIIKNLRVQQAGAVLPLSANARLDKVLGTRHRAAIGVTEETDAVVVVVSEERGQVSLCFNGNIARDLEPSTLRKALLGLFQKKPKPKAKDKDKAAAKPAPSRPARSSPSMAAYPSSQSGAERAPGAGLSPSSISARQVHSRPPTAPRLAEAVPGAVGSSDSQRIDAASLAALAVTQPMQRPTRELLDPLRASSPGRPARTSSPPRAPAEQPDTSTNPQSALTPGLSTPPGGHRPVEPGAEVRPLTPGIEP